MKFLFSGLILVFSFSAFSQADPCSEVVASPEVKATTESANTVFQENLPDSYSAATNAHVVFKVIVNCDGEVSKVVMQDAAMTDAEVEHFSSVIEGMDWTAAQNEGESVKSQIMISLKINQGQASCALH